MQELLFILPGIIERSLIFSIVMFGMYLSSRILKFDDVTVEGSFGVSGAVTAALLTHGIHPIISTLIAIFVGGVAGAITALLHTKLRFNQLISGIIVSTALFSVSLKVAASNVPVTESNIFDFAIAKLLILIPINIALIVLIRWFLQTEIGFMIRATGINQQVVRMLGKRVDRFIILGLILSNMCNALAGSLFVQYVGFFSIWNNVGILIIALAGLILAETVSKELSVNMLLGAFAYQLIIATTFELQLDQDWNKMVTALLIIALIAAKQYLAKITVEKTC